MPAKNPKITTETARHLHALGARIRAQRKKLELNATVAAEAAAPTANPPNCWIPGTGPASGPGLTGVNADHP